MLLRNIPLLRIFDVAKAREFYIDWLGFKVDFEHQFEENMPYYIGISRDDIQFHLTEHHGDSTPGSKVFVVCNGIKEFYNELRSRPYKFYSPAIEETFYGTLEFSVIDPFGNRLTFNEYIK